MNFRVRIRFPTGTVEATPNTSLLGRSQAEGVANEVNRIFSRVEMNANAYTEKATK